ncbi:hypothetical protein AQS8620_01319 [Aquimixticola soesokkakensis]|uniref:Uncharacterized protein n=1 Tax=Aquimixticola soesokkakensis TaxID=1519096 RepID=A0A1Y5SDM1_9RHOB|nr:hypothetical protein [Aquimixticola soesokkakensis]SLN36777.1 hypothetical protein AQS8620_01319 [Aquimixticola soesokkakensis]
MRNLRPASIQSAVQTAIRAGGGLEAVANDLGVGVSTLSHGTELSEQRPGGLGVNYLDRMGRIVPETAVPVAQHFAALAHGFFQPIASSGPQGVSVHQIAKEFADLLGAHAAAHGEGSDGGGIVTKSEARDLLREVDELMAAVAGFRAQLVGISEGER